MAMHVLIIERDRAMVRALRQNLQAAGFQASSVARFKTAEPLQPNIDLILIGPSVPKDVSIEICVALRSERRLRATGIVIISDPPDLQYRIESLSKGADDHIGVPFSFEELSARVAAVLRRATPRRLTSVLRYRDIVLERTAHRVTRGSRTVTLAPREFRLLEVLMENQGRTQSHAQLVAAVWGQDANIDPRTVVSHIAKLRRSLSYGREIDPIRTVRAIEYVIGGTDD